MKRKSLARSGRVLESAGFILLVCFLVQPGAGQERQDNLASRTAWAPTAQSAADRAELERQRREWFYGPRGPHYGAARLEALKQLDRMLAAEAAASKAPGAAIAPSATQWTLIGPRPTTYPGSPGFTASGRVMALAVDPRNANVVYLGANNGGVWKTTDGGVTWSPLTDTQPSLAIRSLALDPSNPDIVYAGTDSGGILKSTDGGATWTNQFTGNVVNSLAVHPTNGQIVLAAVSGRQAIYRSADGGTTWTGVLAGVAGNSVLFDPTNGSVAYAALASPNDPANGVYKSSDAGQTWNRIGGASLPSTNISAIRLAISPSSPSTLYASVAARDGSLNGFFVTSDGGLNWLKRTATPDYCDFCGFVNLHHTLGVHPTNPNIVYAGGLSLFVSPDGGASWKDVGGGGSNGVPTYVDQNAVAFSAAGTKLYLGNDGGAWSTADVGSTSPNWTSLNATLAITQFYPGLSIHPSDPNIGFGGTQDTGAQKYSGSLAWTGTLGGDCGWTAIDSSTPTTVYISCNRDNGLVWKSTSGGDPGTWTAAQSGISTSDFPRQVFPPLVMDPSNPQVLYFGGNTRLYQTTNGATSWTALPPTFNGINAIAVAPSDSNTVYVGAFRQVMVTKNAGAGAGATWTDISAGLPRYPTQIAVDPTTALVAYITFAVDTPHVFKTTNGGTGWTNISGNLPDINVNDIVIDPDLPNTLYVGTDIGVFRSADGGSTWSTLVTGLPRTMVKGLRLHRPSRTLRASTFGRSMWDLLVPLAAQNPKPALASLSPSSATAGGAAFTLTVNGSGFLSSSVVQWKGSNRTTTFVSDSKLTAAITAADIAAAGTAQVTVVNPSPGGGTSNVLTFSINAPTTANPAPVLSSISPSSATAGGAAFTLTLGGSNFLSSSVVQWNGSNRTTTFVSSTQLTAAITAADIATAGTARVTVVNPSPGGGASNALNFTINSVSSPGSGAGIISTVAGSTAGAQLVITGKATEAPLGRVTGVAVAANGNVLLSDGEGNLVLSVSSTGDIAVVAGTGGQGFEGEGGPATKAALNSPGGLATDPSGNLYIADTSNHRVRKVSAAGTITTVAGNGDDGFSGDDSPATQASLSSPAAVAVDASGNLYIADSGNDRIRKVGPDGKITTFAGSGEPEDEVGDGGPATSARLSNPSGVAVDAAGNVLIADTSHHRIRKVAPDGKISTVAGNGMEGFIEDPSKVYQATDISLSFPSGVAVLGGDFYIADTGNNRVREVLSGGRVGTFGNGNADFAGDGSVPSQASFDGPQAVAVDAGRNFLYIADTNNQRVRKILLLGTPARTISTIAGSGRPQSESGGGAATSTRLDHPRDVALDGKGNLYVADFGHNLVRKVGVNGALTTIAGNGEGCCSIEEGGPATRAAIETNGIAVDKADNLYIAAGEELFKVTPDGNIRSLPAAKGSARAVAVDAAGNVYFAGFDADGNGLVKKIAAGGTTAITVAGGGTDLGDGGPGTSAKVFPFALALDTTGNLYIADIGFSRVRRLTPAGVISTVAGNGRQDAGTITDGAAATSVSLFEPAGLAVDGSGNLYISDTGRTAVFKVGPDGKIFRVAGLDGRSGFSGDGGPATSATVNHPFGLALDASGSLYIADTDNDVVRKVTFGTPPREGESGAPKIVVSPSSLSFQAVQGSSSSFQNLSITNGGGGTLSWTLSAATSGGEWDLVINPSTSGTAPSLLGVRTASVRLAPGTYNGTITITAAGASNSPQTVAVKLIVSTTPVPPPAGTPTVTAPAITNGASFRSGVTPGAILTIFGTGLTKGVSGIVVADKLPLPTDLRGTSVTIGGNPAPLFAIANVSGQEQINLQVPWEVAEQPIADVVVNNNGVKGDPVPMVILLIQPGVFTLDGLTGVILHADNRLVSAGAPAKKGEVVIIYATGLGPVDPLPRTGEAAPSSPLSLTTNKPVVTVGNATAAVAFSGLAPGFVGLYQLNVTIPANATSGVQGLVIEIGGVRSKPVTLAIQ